MFYHVFNKATVTNHRVVNKQMAIMMLCRQDHKDSSFAEAEMILDHAQPGDIFHVDYSWSFLVISTKDKICN